MRAAIFLALAASASAAANITAPNNLYCETCVEVAKELESEGCDLACDAIPEPGNYICSWIMEMVSGTAQLVHEFGCPNLNIDSPASSRIRWPEFDNRLLPIHPPERPVR